MTRLHFKTPSGDGQSTFWLLGITLAQTLMYSFCVDIYFHYLGYISRSGNARSHGYSV